jgi:hypothetical protein
MPQFLFLNNTLAKFIRTIEDLWQPFFQIHGIEILLTVGSIALAVYAIQFLATQDVSGLIIGLMYTFIALALLHEVFLKSEYLGNSLLNDVFIPWAREISGQSPDVMTPSGVMETGLQLARLFWVAASDASWWHTPFSALLVTVCSIVVILAFLVASIIYLLALVWVHALIIAASVFLAFAALPWTWSIFPGWALAVLKACLKIFFLLCVLTIGLAEAQGWAMAMSTGVGSIAGDTSLVMETICEAILFGWLVYYLPSALASVVTGGVDEGFSSIIAGHYGGAAQSAAAAGALRGAKAAGVAGKGLATVSKMLLR